MLLADRFFLSIHSELNAQDGPNYELVEKYQEYAARLLRQAHPDQSDAVLGTEREDDGRYDIYPPDQWWRSFAPSLNNNNRSNIDRAGSSSTADVPQSTQISYPRSPPMISDGNRAAGGNTRELAASEPPSSTCHSASADHDTIVHTSLGNDYSREVHQTSPTDSEFNRQCRDSHTRLVEAQNLASWNSTVAPVSKHQSSTPIAGNSEVAPLPSNASIKAEEPLLKNGHCSETASKAPQVGEAGLMLAAGREEKLHVVEPHSRPIELDRGERQLLSPHASHREGEENAVRPLSELRKACTDSGCS